MKFGIKHRVAALAVASAVLLAVGLAPALADSGTYMGGFSGGACENPQDLGNGIVTPRVGIGNVCFVVPAGATTATVTVTDDVTTPPAFQLSGHAADGSYIGERTTFCGGEATFPIPPGSYYVWVYTLDPATAMQECGTANVAVKGTVDVSFS